MRAWPRISVVPKCYFDYDAIFRILAGAQYAGWISVEDGLNGLDELKRSVAFLQEKRAEHY